jgi:hypothetical protein
MRKVLLLCGLLAMFGALAMAENYSGKLLDSSCYDQQKSAKGCDATSSTTSFLLDVNGKVYRLDTTGNTKAADALKNHADRSSNPNKQAGGPINAKVSGTMDGADTLKVDVIEIQ